MKGGGGDAEDEVRLTACSIKNAHLQNMSRESARRNYGHLLKMEDELSIRSHQLLEKRGGGLQLCLWAVRIEGDNCS